MSGDPAKREALTRRLVYMLAGPLVWSLHFALAYALHATLCAAGPRLGLAPAAAADLAPWLLGLLTLLALPPLVLALLRPGRLARLLGLRPVAPAEEDFAAGVTRLLALLSLVALLFSVLAMAALPSCVQLR